MAAVSGLRLCLIFGLLDAIAIRLQGVWLAGMGEVPVQLIQALPYLLTVFLLAGFIGRAVAPKAAGVPYERSIDGRPAALARRMMLDAHAPYSKFHVGAAVRGEDGCSMAAATSRTPLTRKACAPSPAIAALVAAAGSASSNTPSSDPAPK